MSLEEAIRENTAAVKENSELLREAAAGRAEVLAAAKEASTKAKPAPKASAEKPAESKSTGDAAAEAASSAAAIATTQATGATPTLNKCQQAVADYLDGTEGAEREARGAKVKEVLGKVGVAKAGEVPADKEAAFIRTFDKLKEQGNLVKADEPEDFV